MLVPERLLDYYNSEATLLHYSVDRLKRFFSKAAFGSTSTSKSKAEIHAVTSYIDSWLRKLCATGSETKYELFINDILTAPGKQVR